MSVDRAKINFTDLPARRTIKHQPRLFREDSCADRRREPQILATRFPRIPNLDDTPSFALGLAALGTGGQIGSEFGFALVRAVAQIIGADIL